MNQNSTKPHTGNVTPEDLADRSLHRQQQVFETENRTPEENIAGVSNHETTRTSPAAEQVGDAAGRDTSRAVARLAEMNQPGASSKLGGTPGANATPSTGRGTNY